ncbi:hypothetical protein EV714DRAFT_277550 [Schizophyllum commune]
MGGVAVTVRSMLALPDDDLQVTRTFPPSAPRRASDILCHAVSSLLSLSSTSSGRRTTSAGNIERDCLPLDCPRLRRRQPPWGMRTRPSSHLRAHVTHHSYGGLDGVWADCECLCRAPLAPVIAPSNEAPRVDFVSSSSPDCDYDYDMEDCERGPHPALPGLSSLFAHPSDYDADADFDFDTGTGTGFECDQEYERRPCSRMPSTGTHHSYGGFDGTGRDGWDVRSGAFCAVPSPSRGGWRSLRFFSAAATARRYLD